MVGTANLQIKRNSIKSVSLVQLSPSKIIFGSLLEIVGIYLTLLIFPLLINPCGGDSCA